MPRRLSAQASRYRATVFASILSTTLVWIGPGATQFAKQRAELAKIQDEARSRDREIAGRMHDEMAKCRESLGPQRKRDRAAMLAAYDRMAALRRQHVEIALDTADRMDQVLTPEQSELPWRWTPWWARGRDGAR